MHVNLSCCTTKLHKRFTKSYKRVILHRNLNRPEKKSQKNKFPPSQKSTKMWVQAVSGHYIYNRRKTTLLNNQQDFQCTFTQFTPASHLWKMELSVVSFQIKGDLRVSQLPKQRYEQRCLKCRFCRGSSRFGFIDFPKNTVTTWIWVKSMTTWKNVNTDYKHASLGSYFCWLMIDNEQFQHVREIKIEWFCLRKSICCSKED